ncbi:hypothetical protein GCM10023317_25430 [Actinopolymorpha pittospori]|uniref:SF4 helicase domain-containing protein n=1 Tax=Actinopolymorpha pittospori TaxID=648752 RepID=A0A927MMS2_9ACTN|nr:DnaB-like helicase C-terminal domain-containing protein [Actinopolymorpha pittospori]MBE1603399.1 hypothetical protein [Actinopolymorpha pittospori]
MTAIEPITEQDADVVILLHRDDYYNAEDHPGEADLTVAKDRSGPAGGRLGRSGPAPVDVPQHDERGLTLRVLCCFPYAAPAADIAATRHRSTGPPSTFSATGAGRPS